MLANALDGLIDERVGPASDRPLIRSCKICVYNYTLRV